VKYKNSEQGREGVAKRAGWRAGVRDGGKKGGRKVGRGGLREELDIFQPNGDRTC